MDKQQPEIENRGSLLPCQNWRVWTNTCTKWKQGAFHFTLWRYQKLPNMNEREVQENFQFFSSWKPMVLSMSYSKIGKCDCWILRVASVTNPT